MQDEIATQVPHAHWRRVSLPIQETPKAWGHRETRRLASLRAGSCVADHPSAVGLGTGQSALRGSDPSRSFVRVRVCRARRGEDPECPLPKDRVVGVTGRKYQQLNHRGTARACTRAGSDKHGDAYLLHAFLAPVVDHPEADFRRGLELSPNNALGYERFARVLFWFRSPDPGRFDLAKREEAFVMIDRARAINPLAPSRHLTKGVMMLQGRSDTKAATPPSVAGARTGSQLLPGADAPRRAQLVLPGRIRGGHTLW